MAVRDLRDLPKSKEVSGRFASSEKRGVTGYKNGFRFEFTASDATGSIKVKFWGTGDEEAVRRAYDGVPENGVVSITGGTVGEWQGTKEIHVDQKASGAVKAVEDANPEDYLPASKRDIPGMAKEVCTYLPPASRA